MAGSIDKANVALDEIIERFERINTRLLSPEGKVIVSASIDHARVLKMLLNSATPVNDR